MPFGPLMTDLRKRACQLQALQEAEGYDEIFAQLTKACGYLKNAQKCPLSSFSWLVFSLLARFLKSSLL